MTGSSRLAVLLATVLAVTALYAPQPLLPMLARDLDTTESAVALLITVTMVPLALAPIVYGFLLESFPARRVLVIACTLLGLTWFGLALGPEYRVFLVIRFLQGLLIPAIFTGLMTYVAATARPGGLSRAMAVYVATTVFGGFVGRALVGLLADVGGWQIAFTVLGALLLVAAFRLTRLRDGGEASFVRAHPRVILEVLRVPGLWRWYLTIFCAFFTFASVLNYLPFRTIRLDEDASATVIALIYAGYLMGLVVSLLAGRIVREVGGEVRTVLAGLYALALGTALFLVPSLPVMILNMFLFAGAMFLIHSVIPGRINRVAAGRRGVVNGLYIAAYYGGGSAGSYLPGLVLHHLGWGAYIASLLLVLAIAVVLVPGTWGGHRDS